MTGGSATATASVKLELDGLSAADGKITLKELTDGLQSTSALDVTPELKSSLSATLPISASTHGCQAIKQPQVTLSFLGLISAMQTRFL